LHGRDARPPFVSAGLVAHDLPDLEFPRAHLILQESLAKGLCGVAGDRIPDLLHLLLAGTHELIVLRETHRGRELMWTQHPEADVQADYSDARDHEAEPIFCRHGIQGLLDRVRLPGTVVLDDAGLGHRPRIHRGDRRHRLLDRMNAPVVLTMVGRKNEGSILAVLLPLLPAAMLHAEDEGLGFHDCELIRSRLALEGILDGMSAALDAFPMTWRDEESLGLHDCEAILAHDRRQRIVHPTAIPATPCRTL